MRRQLSRKFALLLLLSFIWNWISQIFSMCSDNKTKPQKRNLNPLAACWWNGIQVYRRVENVLWIVMSESRERIWVFPSEWKGNTLFNNRQVVVVVLMFSIFFSSTDTDDAWLDKKWKFKHQQSAEKFSQKLSFVGASSREEFIFIIGFNFITFVIYWNSSGIRFDVRNI